MTPPKYRQSFTQTNLSSSAAVKATPGRVMAVQVYTPTNVNGIVQFMNDGDGNGTALLTLGNDGITNGFGGSHLEDYSNLGGFQFGDKIYCKITGSGVLVVVWYD